MYDCFLLWLSRGFHRYFEHLVPHRVKRCFLRSNIGTQKKRKLLLLFTLQAFALPQIINSNRSPRRDLCTNPHSPLIIFFRGIIPRKTITIKQMVWIYTIPGTFIVALFCYLLSKVAKF